ncbi:MAG: ROK family transcriptional regulator [Dorea sp.]|nr:ROK family transcriptional regulator [Dorea sp.]
MAVVVDQKKLTRQSIYQYIYQSDKPLTKGEIASGLKISLPTVYRSVGDLEKDNVIKLVEEVNEKGKRTPVGYAVNKDIAIAVGVAVSAYSLSLCVVNAKMEELGFKKVKVRSFDSEEIGRQIAEELPKFLFDFSLSAGKLQGLGISLPGIIDEDHNTVVFSPTLKMKNIKVDKMLECIPLDVPIYVDNDSTCAGYAEKDPFEKEQRNNTFAYIFLENGVGGSICIEGKPFFGVNHRSGEFGHMKVGTAGLPCTCGKEDCLEAYIGAGRFSSNMGILIEEFMEDMNKGNEEYKEMWIDGIKHLAVAINNLRTAFDCDIILGGFMTEHLEPYMDLLKEEVLKINAFEENADFIRIGNFARRSSVKGMARYVMTQFLENI